jgi:chromosome segregation ATPase
MANVELSQNEYQKLLDDSTELRSSRREIEKLTSEMENKNKAIEDERTKRKKLDESFKALEVTLEEKDKELETIKTEYADFEAIKEKADKWSEYEETKTTEIQTKLNELTSEVWEETLEKHKKFIETMSDDLKVEYLENLKQAKTPETFSNNPWEQWEKPQTPPNNRLVELRTKKESWELSPSEKIEYLTLVSKSESE